MAKCLRVPSLFARYPARFPPSKLLDCSRLDSSFSIRCTLPASSRARSVTLYLKRDVLGTLLSTFALNSRHDLPELSVRAPDTLQALLCMFVPHSFMIEVLLAHSTFSCSSFSSGARAASDWLKPAWSSSKFVSFVKGHPILLRSHTRMMQSSVQLHNMTIEALNLTLCDSSRRTLLRSPSQTSECKLDTLSDYPANTTLKRIERFIG